MFGKINNIQDISNNSAKLCKNFKFVAVSIPISEEKTIIID